MRQFLLISLTYGAEKEQKVRPEKFVRKDAPRPVLVEHRATCVMSDCEFLTVELKVDEFLEGEGQKLRRVREGPAIRAAGVDREPRSEEPMMKIDDVEL
ncbi:MAG TPA: hypothetical protein VIQ62_01720 [Burkholderiales bacterium]